ncbi:putative prolyl 4-hydroxylase 7 [Castilleja foliolosa]|uniref:Prolyl 4-hydroxylase 7 n=1 Tax=Castilleja foliolosa TaxID=1961234 RepID=A0ABD3D4G5_9LAMI
MWGADTYGRKVTRRTDEIVSGIEAKIAAMTFLPQENGEGMQILHYDLGQKPSMSLI